MNSSQRGTEPTIVSVTGTPAAPPRQYSYRVWLIALVAIGLALGLLAGFFGELGDTRPAL